MPKIIPICDLVDTNNISELDYEKDKRIFMNKLYDLLEESEKQIKAGKAKVVSECMDSLKLIYKWII